MYENMTFENVMDRCLDRVSASVDKREGSIVYDAIAPAAAELAILYIELAYLMDRAFPDTETGDDLTKKCRKREGSIVYDAIAPAAAELAILYIELAYLMDRAFPDTETGDDLTKKCRERSVFRTAATQAVRKGYFEKADGGGCDMEIGTRFSGGDINFTVTERIAPGQYSLTAETAGTVGNEYVGTLFPIDYVPELAAARLADILIPGEDEESDDALRARYFESTVGNEYVGTLFPIDYVPELAAARLADILIPGEDEESDDALRARYFESLKSQAFGGNIADYKNKVELLPGVGAVKVFPVWNGGGTVKIVLVDSEWGVPSSELVKQVQEAIDPVNTQGTGVGLAPIGHVVTGVGLAPIGHVVTVAGVTGSKIDVSFNLTFEGGASWTSTQDAVKAAIQSYFDSLARTWADTENLIVRVSQIETKVLNVDGVIDITGTKINQGTANISLGGEAIPVLGAVTNGN